MRSPRKFYSQQTLLSKCLPESDTCERVVDAHIYNLRKKPNSAWLNEPNNYIKNDMI
ncbi:winged helix-turn-helix domain-containing protein [Serratia sp. IR-2025]